MFRKSGRGLQESGRGRRESGRGRLIGSGAWYGDDRRRQGIGGDEVVSTERALSDRCEGARLALLEVSGEGEGGSAGDDGGDFMTDLQGVSQKLYIYLQPHLEHFSKRRNRQLQK